jgi:uncharacterized protein YegP (UPF0339 family)
VKARTALLAFNQQQPAEKSMAGKFEIFRDKAGEHRFRLKAGNGETILTSEGDKDKAGCGNGIESVRKNASDPARFEKVRTDGGQYRFNLKAANHQVIGTSQNYDSESGRDNGIKSVSANAPAAAVVEV